MNGEVFEQYAYIELPYCRHDSALKFLMKANDKKRRVSLGFVKFHFRQVLRAIHELKYLSGLCHLDIKPDNVVLDNDLSAKLIDFGHASQWNYMVNRVTGTDIYMAPEIY